MGWIDQPDWRGRQRYWDVRWGRTPETDIAVGKFRQKHSQGWQDDWFLLFRRLGEDQVNYRYLFSQSFQTSGTSVTLSSLSPAWNNANNFVEGVGAGASGGAAKIGTNNYATGGGGGEYRKIANFTDPGGATPMTIGAGGPAAATGIGNSVVAVNGTDGTNTTWNTNSLIAVGGKKGLGSNAAGGINGGVGGTGGTGAAANNDGGRGGNETGATNLRCGSGAGGAGGPNGAGNQGVDSASTTQNNTAGGQGDGTSGGAGGSAATSTGTDGSAGTELGDGVHGCGGGGAGSRAGANALVTGGSGGLYGGGGGGAANVGSGNNASTGATSGAGRDGIIVLTWTAAAGPVNWGFDTPNETGFGRPKPKNKLQIFTGDQGNQLPFVWITPQSQFSGWEVQPPLPPHRRSEKAGAIMRGDDGIEDIRRLWVNLGTEQIRSQEPRRRWERTAATMRGDDGTEFPFVPPSVNPWAFDQPANIKPRKPVYAALKGRSEFAFFPQWQNFGFDQTQSQPLHRFFKSPTRGDQGIQSPFVPPAVTSWGFDVQQQVAPRRPRTHMDIGGADDGIGFPQINWFNTGWEVQPPLPPHPRPERSGAVMRGDDGTEFPFVPPQVTTWWEIQPTLHPNRLFKSPTTGDTGIYYPLINWFNFGWEVQPPQPPHRIFKSPPTGDVGIQFPLINFYPYGWEIQPPQPPHPRPERAASFLFGDTGAEAPFIFVTSNPMGWQVRAWQPPHPWREKRFAAMARGDDGIEFSFIRWFNAGWEPSLSFPQRVFRERRAAIFRGDEGIQGRFVQWRNTGWEPVLSFPQRVFRERRAGIFKGDEGIQGRFVQWRNTGWEPVLGFPQRVIRERREGAVALGSPGTEFPFVGFFPFGWVIQPWQPPHPRPERAGGIMAGDTGIVAPFRLVTATPTWGFTQPDIIYRHQFERAGGLLWGDTGIQFPYIPPFVPPPPIRHADKLMVIGDPDAFFGPTSIGYVGGSKIFIDDPVNMVFDMKRPIAPTDAIDIVLTAPDGSIRHGDPRFAFTSDLTFNYYTFVPFWPHQYVAYVFAQGELDQIGHWQVSITISSPGGQWTSSIRTFEVFGYFRPPPLP